MSIKNLLTIKANQQIADKIYKLELSGNYNLEEFAPGKFLHIKCSDSIDPTLRRPMSICDIDDAGKLMTVLYRADGKGTKLLSDKHIGETLDVLAPLGVEFPQDAVKPGQTALLIGGGIGVPPLYYLGRKLKQRGVKIKSILGFNSAKDVFYEAEFASLGEVQISTMDGTYGHHGLVTDLLETCHESSRTRHASSEPAELTGSSMSMARDEHNTVIGLSGQVSWDTLYTCGPTAMLKAIQKIISKDKTAFMSLEERMACGIGACLACVCKSTDPNNTSYNRVCTEGPVFPLHSINL